MKTACLIASGERPPRSDGHGLFGSTDRARLDECLRACLYLGVNPARTQRIIPQTFLSFVIWVAGMLQLPGATNALNVIHFKQGCSILCPQDMNIEDKANIEKMEKDIQGELDKLRPKLKHQPNKGQFLLMAADNLKSPTRQLHLVIGPPEMSQNELKAMPPDQIRGLQKFMLDQISPILKQTGKTITRNLDPKVIEGRHLSYFHFAYEFSDSSKIPQISLRSYYYTKAATFIATFSCQRDYYERNKATVQSVLGSLNESGD